MATPILSKPQQRKSLSAKKTPVRGLKNVLAQPCSTPWPVLKDDQDCDLENLLRKLLAEFKPVENKIPWSKLYKMKKEERAAARKAAAQCTSNADSKESPLNFLIFGINKITRSLEKDELCCVLLDANVNPAMLVKHLVQMGELKAVPTLLISFLKIVTLETVGFASAAVALKKEVQDAPEHYFHSLFKKVYDLSSVFIKKKVPIVLFKENSLEDSTIEIESSPKKSTNVSILSYFDQSLHLQRDSIKTRVFNPPCWGKEENTAKIDTDFIPIVDDNLFNCNEKTPKRFFQLPLSDSNNEVTTKISEKTRRELKRSFVEVDKSLVTYKPLKVLRRQGNQCRTKATKPSK